MKIVLILTFIGLVIGLLLGLIRTINSKGRTNRIMGINIIGSLSTLAIALLAFYLEESWLLDVCIVYSLMSFLAVVFLTKISIIEKKEGDEDDD